MGLFGKKKKEKADKKEEKELKEKQQKIDQTSVKNKSEDSKETKTPKETPKEKIKTTKKPIYRVVYDKELRLWLIKKDGAKRTIASFVTKEEALNRVKALSQTNDMNFVVHKKDGKFQKK